MITKAHQVLVGPHTLAPVTPIYGEPELLIEPSGEVCELEYGCSADVWAFGCIVYEMLAGVPLALCHIQNNFSVASAVLARIGLPPQTATISS